MALALNVRLSKPGVYVLNADGDHAAAGDLLRADTFATRAVFCVVVLAVLCLISLLVVRV